MSRIGYRPVHLIVRGRFSGSTTVRLVLNNLPVNCPVLPTSLWASTSRRAWSGLSRLYGSVETLCLPVLLHGGRQWILPMGLVALYRVSSNGCRHTGVIKFELWFSSLVLQLNLPATSSFISFSHRWPSHRCHKFVTSGFLRDFLVDKPS